MEDKYLLILGLFNDYREKTISAKEIALKMGYSTRTIMRYINIVNSLDDNESFRIFSIKNKGFKLQIIKEKEYENFYNNAVAHKLLPEDQSKLLFRLIIDDLSINYLEKNLNYSQPSISRLIGSLNEKLANRRLTIIRRNNVYSLYGNEIQIRNFGQYLWQLNGFDVSFLPKQYIAEFTKCRDFLKKHDVTDLPDLQCFLYISLIRAYHGHSISFSPVLRDIFDENTIKNGIVAPIEEYYKENYNCNFTEDELVFISLMLSNDSNYSLNESINSIMPIVNKLLKNIDMKYGTDFENDNELLNAFCSHIASNMTGYILMNKTDNSLLEQIRLNFTNEHVYALELAGNLYELLGVIVSDEDIGYLTLHFANCNAKKRQQEEIEAIVIYHQSVVAANLLSAQLKKHYPQLNIRIKKENELNDKDELVITYETDENIGRAVKVSLTLNEEDRKNIDQAIMEKIGFDPFKNLCDKDNFYIIDKLKSKKEFFQMASNQLVEKELITPEEINNILEREKLSSTEIAMGVAFPHGIVSSKSFLAIYIFKQPIFWHTDYIRMVLLMGYNKNERVGNTNAIKYLFSNLFDFQKIEKLMSSVDFDEFIENLRGKKDVK